MLWVLGLLWSWAARSCTAAGGARLRGGVRIAPQLRGRASPPCPPDHHSKAQRCP